MSRDCHDPLCCIPTWQTRMESSSTPSFYSLYTTSPCQQRYTLAPGPHIGGASVKMMQEMIPVAYEVLRCEIDSLQEEVWMKQVPPVMSRETFWYMYTRVNIHTQELRVLKNSLHSIMCCLFFKSGPR